MVVQQVTQQQNNYFKYDKVNSFYCYLEDGIQYQMNLKCLLQLKEFLARQCNVNMRLPINCFYKQLQKEDKNEVIVRINKSYTIKI
jgi:plasmid maintenance system killer protein